jgi:hypothetical protein
MYEMYERLRVTFTTKESDRINEEGGDLTYIPRVLLLNLEDRNGKRHYTVT